MMKRLCSFLILITMLLVMIAPSYAQEVTINNKNENLTMKEKYIEYLSDNPELDEHQIIVKFKNKNNMSGILPEEKNFSEKNTFENISTEEQLITNMTMTTIDKLNLSSKCELVRTIDNSNVSILQAKTNNVAELIEALNGDEEVLYAQVDYKMITAEEPIDIQQWALQNIGQTVDKSTGEPGFDIDVINAWDVTKGTNEIVVGVIDTGIDILHPDLVNNVWSNANEIINNIDDDGNGYVDDINGWDFASDDNSVYDMDALDEHGTHMAGIIASNGLICGVAPNVKFMPLKAMNYASGYTSDIIEAINYARMNGVKIINCSFASIYYNPALEEAISSNPDILFVCAAGNYGKPTTELATFPACYDLDNIIAVSAANNKGQLSEISTYGDYVDVCAPGIGIYSTLPENKYGFRDGTSCSAAFVSGVAALLLSNNMDLCAIELKNKIINSCGESIPKQINNGEVDSEGVVNASLAFSASKIIGKFDNFKYTTEQGENVLFDKYPFEIIMVDGKLKMVFDTTKEISNFNLKIYQNTDEKENLYLVNSNISTDSDYVLSGIVPDVNYNVAIKLSAENEVTEYTAILKYVLDNQIEYVDFDILTEEKYDTNIAIPVGDIIYESSEQKNNLFETLAAGTKYEVENNNSIDLADITYDDYDNYGCIGNTFDVDYFQIMFSDDGVANFWLGNIPSGSDYDLYLYDAGGTLLAKSDKADTVAELISYYPVESGVNYYIMVSTYSGYSTSNPYLLRAKWYETPSEYENNDTVSNAYTLPGYTSNVISEKISSSSDVDYYKVIVPQNSIFELVLERPTVNYRFEIYDSYNTYQSLISTIGNQYTHELASGTYYVKIYSILGNSTSSYTLSINCSPLYTISTTEVIAGEMAATDSVYYKLILSSALGIRFDLSGFEDSDYDMYWYNSQNAVVTYSTTSDDVEIMQAVVESGTYLVKVHRYDGFGSSFTLESSIVIPSNDAYLTYENSYPTEMKANSVKTVEIHATNEGANTWTSAGGYKLAMMNDSSSFVSGDRTFSSSDTIGYGSSKLFIFNIIAPNVDTITPYTTGWQMKQNNLTFGNKITKNVTVKPNYEELTIGTHANVLAEAVDQMLMFTVETSGYYAIRTFYNSEDVDTVLKLYNSSMVEIAYNDDVHNGNLYSRIETYLTPGTYYVSLSEYNDKPIYCQILVEGIEINTLTTGTAKNVSNLYEGYYEFSVASAGTYIIGTKYYSQNSDTYLVLYDDIIAENASIISYNDNDSSNYARMVVDLEPGTYYIRVTTYDYMNDAVRKKVSCKLSLTMQSSTPLADYSAHVDITYPSNNSVVKLYDGASLKIIGSLSNVSSVVVKVNGNLVQGVKKTGNRFECNYTPDESGEYTIVATANASYGGNSPSDSVNITIVINDDGDTFDTATMLKVGTERTAAIDYEEDIDCFMFSPGKSDMYSVYTTGSTDTVISVYNSLYALNAYNDDDYTQTSNLNADAPLYLQQNQLYYIIVHGADENGTGMYNLCINRLLDDNVSVKTLVYESSLNGKIDYPEDEDVYTFYPADSGTYIFKSLGTSDVMGVVYDSDGNFIAFNDDKSETDTNCEIIVELDAGRPYYFAIKHNLSYMYRQNYKVIVE